MAEAATEPRAFTSEDYWRRIFARNPDFCSWQSDRQNNVRALVTERLNEVTGPLRVLDFGIGNLGLYRALDDGLMRRISLTGISESPQHREDDPLLARYRIRVAIGAGLSPLESVADGSQNVVLCTYVLDYLDEPMRAAALAAFARVLAPGGRLVLVLHHPRGERERKFRSAEPYWPIARALYDRLVEGRFGQARRLLHTLNTFLSETFPADPGFERYLASYLKTATRFLAMFCADEAAATPRPPIPEEALVDCDAMRWLIDREWAMTCRAFRPIDDPGQTLRMPAELRLTDVVECIDPTRGFPIAHVLTAVGPDSIEARQASAIRVARRP
ncbi:MAG TPA: methyltransferase domain-containing protein [Pseudomonadales bacterium]